MTCAPASPICSKNPCTTTAEWHSTSEHGTLLPGTMSYLPKNTRRIMNAAALLSPRHFRQSQTLAQVAAKYFRCASDSLQKYFLHIEESLTSNTTSSNGQLTSRRWELEKKPHSFAPLIFRRDSEKPPSLLEETPWISGHTKLSSWRAKHEPHKHHSASSPPQVPGDHHVAVGIAQCKPIGATHHANK